MGNTPANRLKRNSSLKKDNKQNPFKEQASNVEIKGDSTTQRITTSGVPAEQVKTGETKIDLTAEQTKVELKANSVNEEISTSATESRIGQTPSVEDKTNSVTQRPSNGNSTEVKEVPATEKITEMEQPSTSGQLPVIGKSPDNAYTMTVDWDIDQQYFVIKIQSSPTKSIPTNLTAKLYAVGSQNFFASFAASIAKGEDQNVTFFADIFRQPTNDDLKNAYVMKLEDSNKNVLLETPQFEFPSKMSDLAKTGRVPRIDGKFLVTWNSKENCFELDWSRLSLDPNLYLTAFVYESSETRKMNPLYSVLIGIAKTTNASIPSKMLVKEGKAYYVKLITRLQYIKSFACSADVTVDKISTDIKPKEACKVDFDAPEVETREGFDQVVMRIRWKFQTKAFALSQNDKIAILPEHEQFEPKKFYELSVPCSGDFQGEVEIAVGGYVQKDQSYRLYYSAHEDPWELGRSENVVQFSMLPEYDDVIKVKAKEESRKVNFSALTQYSASRNKEVTVDYNPLLSFKPQPSELEHLLKEKLDKRKKKIEDKLKKEPTSILHQKSAEKPDIKPISATELANLVEKDFTEFGGFIYAGAGVSIAAPSCSPSWWVLMNDLVRNVFEAAPQQLDYLKASLASGDVTRQPEEIMESFYFVLQDHLLTVFQLLEAGEPNANHIAIAKLAKAGTLKGILTTNFDIFIERALTKENVPFKTVVTAEEFSAYYDSGCKEFAVLKIHGTVDRPSTIVAVANHYKNGKGFSGAKELVLAHFLRNHPTLFVGYSGWDFLHQNYQSFWENEGLNGGKKVYWLNLLGAKGGPNLAQVLGTHIGSRLVVGEGLMPSWACEFLGRWDAKGAEEVMSFHNGLDVNSIQSSLLEKRQQFLVKWCRDLPKPQLLTLIELEGTALNQKSQDRLKRQREALQSQDEVIDTTTSQKLIMELVQNKQMGKISDEEYRTELDKITITSSFQYVYLPKEKKRVLIDTFVNDVKSNPVFQNPTYKSLFPSIISAISEG